MNLMIDDLFEVGSFRLRTAKTNFMEASLKFYQQFASLEMDQKLRKYEFEGYLFMIVKGRIGNYNYALNLAHKSTNVNDVPEKMKLQKYWRISEDFPEISTELQLNVFFLIQHQILSLSICRDHKCWI